MNAMTTTTASPWVLTTTTVGASSSSMPPCPRYILTGSTLRLTMTRLRHGSERLGVCEGCQQYAETMWLAHVERHFRHQFPDGQWSEGWTYYQSPLPGMFAHRSCIESRARSLGIPTDLLPRKD